MLFFAAELLVLKWLDLSLLPPQPFDNLKLY